MDLISGPQDDGSADELAGSTSGIFRYVAWRPVRDAVAIYAQFPQRRYFLCTYIDIYLFFVLKCLWLRVPTLSMRNVPQNVQSLDFWQQWYYKNCIKKIMMLSTHPTFRWLVIEKRTSFYLHRLLTLSVFWDKLLFEISILCYFTRSPNFFAYIIF